MEEWRQILQFPGYSVSSEGRVRNDALDRIMRPGFGGGGHPMVYMSLDGRQRGRSVARLVAEHFLPLPPQHFNTPIHLDGVHMHCYVDNLMWRPRWFANRYTSQFNQDFGNHPPIRDRNTLETFKSIWNVVSLRGLLYIDVVRSIEEATYTFPTMDTFEWVV